MSRMKSSRNTDAKEQEYDAWYDQHIKVFYSELAAIKKVLGNVYQEHRSIEIGVGTGRFAQALHITYGADPSRRMLELARERNIICIQAVVEDLPLKDKSLDLALMVTIDPFMTDMQQAFAEVRRILKTDGRMVLGMIDRNSRLGDAYEKKYEKRQHEKGSYSPVKLHSVDEIKAYIHEAGFRDITIVQTLFRPLEMITDIEPVRGGSGDGGFVVIRADK